MKTFTKNIFTGTYNKQLLSGVIGLFAVYSFFIVSTVVAINQRKNTNTLASTTQSQVSDLEIKYFSLDSGISPATATSLGFVDSQTPTFAYVDPQAEKVAMAH